MSRGTFVRALLVIAVAAFAWRVTYVLIETRHRDALLDEVYYRQVAEQLADGEVFEDPPVFGGGELESAEHPPLTVLALTPAALLFEGNEVAMRVTVAAVGTAVVVLVGMLAGQLAGRRAGVVAAALAAAYANLWANDGLLMAETFATAATAAALLLCYRLHRRPQPFDAVLLGTACGLAMLSRSEMALLVPLAAVPAALLARSVPLRRRVALAGLAVGSATLVVSPWVAFNLSRFERPVLMSYGDGGVLLGANCDITYYGSDIGQWHGLCGAGFRESREHSVGAEDKREEGLEYMRSNLDRLPVVMAARVGRLWGVFQPFDSTGEIRPTWVIRLGWGMFLALAALAVAGAVRLRRRRGASLVLLLAPMIAVTLVAAAYYGVVRFRAPAEVSLVVLAGIAIDAWLPGRAPDSASTEEDEGGRSLDANRPVPEEAEAAL